MSKSTTEALEFGAVPRARLLPPEVLQRVKDKRARRGAVSLIVVAVIASLAATVLATLYSLSAAVTLAIAQAETVAILAEQDQYADIRGLQSELLNATDARTTAMATEVDWETWHSAIVSKLPAGASIVSAVIDAGTPIESYPAPAVPLQGMRIAGITYETSTPTIVELSEWLVAIESVAGFVDSTTTVISQNPATGSFIASTIIYVDESIYTLRFDESE